MPYKLSFNEEDKIVLMQAFGQVTHDEHCDARQKAALLLRENNCLMALVDLRNLDTQKSSIQNCFDFGQSLAEEDVDPSTRMAVVLPTDLASIKDVQFVTTVAANRGRPTRQFKTIEEAKKWLLQS